MKAPIVLALSVLMVSGCAHMNSRGIGYQSGGDRLFVWGSDYSAGIGTRRGICAQGALSVRGTSINADIEADRSLANLIVPGSVTGDNAGPLAQAEIATQQSVMLTNATTAQTAYANLAFFYICQIALNEDVTGPQIVQMWTTANQAAVQVGQSGVNPATLMVPVPGLDLSGTGDVPLNVESNGTQTPAAGTAPQQ